MNTVETILVILLAVGFATLIILSIVLVSIMIAIMKNVRRISQRAEEATGNIAEVVSSISSRLAPLAASGLVGIAMRWFKNRK